MLKRFLKITAVFTIALSIVIMGCSCFKNGDKLKKVTLSEVTHSVFYAPQYAALVLGFFEENGLDIELSTGQGADAVSHFLIFK